MINNEPHIVQIYYLAYVPSYAGRPMCLEKILNRMRISMHIGGSANKDAETSKDHILFVLCSIQFFTVVFFQSHVSALWN